MNTKRWTALGVFAVLLFAYVVIRSTFALFAEDDDPSTWNTEVYRSGGLSQIALLEVQGAIMNTDGDGLFVPMGYQHERFLKKLENAFTNRNIQAIVLRIDSPGGAVVEVDEVHNKLRQLQEQYEKPVVVSMGSSATSGGYYIAAPADKIYANYGTITGSIGVITSNYNISELLDNIGIEDRSFASGEHKQIGSVTQPMTEEQEEIMQQMVDDLYQGFVDIVASGRNMPMDDVLELADGRIFTGSQAVEVGLVDELGYIDDAIDTAAELAGVSNPTVLRYRDPAISPLGLFFGSNRVSMTELMNRPIPFEHSLPHNLPQFLYMTEW